jgi:outer membrane protein OmpA-like peptidoglycan-associated protein
VHLDVRFAFGSDRIAPGDVTLLDNLAAALRDVRLLPERFAIAGHTDAVGPAAVNLELSCARALAVVRHLQTQGVEAARLTAYGFGSARLLPGAPPTAAVHRRVEIRRAPWCVADPTSPPALSSLHASDFFHLDDGWTPGHDVFSLPSR